ncbi:DUF4349 domain-containing protein [Hyphomonas pacifica]|uniref:DUF4349 domain-containing protein n=1 Tax=Hyphomonas pacifica TaxID=1280941 RepID=A0A062U2H5_9PROT|nr:DUF4349 domain-containing protein [Hyphomonas pacifica]KCZ50814.1 hypothetical protein HY2_13285 [Hyphomonas pacifica]RAN33327.1 hypothetical protein HY3_13355 [Hyphomonas pacifica]RAN36986.1 hypothetical protein HY11_10285 [Hyphomonas pacifica]
MKHTIPVIACAMLALAACGGPNSDVPERAMSAPSPAPVAQQDMAFERSPSGGDGAPVEEAAQQYIAYSHSLGLRLPVKSIEPVMDGHVAACNAAGPSKCIVTNSWYNSYSDDEASGSLQLRATPDWIESFLKGVDEEAEAANGEVTNRQTTAEDLTVSIIDTDARLNAQQTLQRRLEDLLANREGELGDILATERELARVNGEIDSLKSSLKALMLRVEMSRLDINYETKRNPVSQSALSPIANAFGDFFYNLSGALAAVITAFAVGLPWLILIGVFLWVWLKLIWPRLRKKKAPKAD